MTFIVLAASSAMLEAVREGDEPISFLHRRDESFMPVVRDFKDELFVLDAFHESKLRRLVAEVLGSRSATAMVCGDARFAAESACLAAELDVPLVADASPSEWIRQARNASATVTALRKVQPS